MSYKTNNIYRIKRIGESLEIMRTERRYMGMTHFKNRRQGILQTFVHFPHKKRWRDPKSGIAIFFYVCKCILYLSRHGERVLKFCRSHFSGERQEG